MSDRIPLADLTVDQYAAFCDEADRMALELAALRAVARGYCPHCGRGDAAPTVDDWEQQRKRADQAETQVEQHRHLRAVAGIHFRAIGHLLNDAGIRLPDNVARLCQLLDDELTLTLDELAERHPAVLDRPTAGPAATQATEGKCSPDGTETEPNTWTEPTHPHPCTATIEGRATPGGRQVQCTREAGHPENHVGPKQGSNGRVLWTDSNAGAVPHRRG